MWNPFQRFFDEAYKRGFVDGHISGFEFGYKTGTLYATEFHPQDNERIDNKIRAAIEETPLIEIVEPGSPEDPFHAEPEEVAEYEAELDQRESEVKEFGFAEWQAMKQKDLEDNRGPLPATTGVPAFEMGHLPEYASLRLRIVDSNAE